MRMVITMVVLRVRAEGSSDVSSTGIALRDMLYRSNIDNNNSDDDDDDDDDDCIQYTTTPIYS